MASQNEEPTFYNLMIRLSQELEEFLIDAGAYESEYRKLHKKKVLDQLCAIVKKWINAVVDEFSIRNACFSDSAPSAEIYPFGSYSLDVNFR